MIMAVAMVMILKRRIPTRMQALVSNVNEDAVGGPINAEKIINRPFHCPLAVLIFVDGNHGGAGFLSHR